jgi:hypothetical protein
MVATALLFTLALILGVAFFLMGELKFLVAFKTLLLTQYGGLIAAYFGLLFINLFAATYALNRKFFLKDTGTKLSHLDKQFGIGEAQIPTPQDDAEEN